MSATGPAVFITVPKYVAISSTMTLPKIRPAPTTNMATTSDDNMSVDENAAAPRGKKRRLDHLTWEEKIQRKKLKNRVAAQTSRDRKKARMEEMEREIDDLTQKTEILQNKCESLQTINESLLEKNHKLDLEVQLLRQQLKEVQERQKQQQEQLTSNAAKLNSNAIGTCAGCESILNGSAAGITTNGLTVDRRTIAKEQNASVTLEDYSALPTLQDMLLIDEEEFDASKLEELAESLLADIAADMEASNGACNENAPKNASCTERLSGSVVGTKTECMESSGNTKTTTSNCINVDDKKATASDLKMDDDDAIRLQDKLTAALAANATLTAHTTTPITPIASPAPAFTLRYEADDGIEIDASTAAQETVYGTYDAKTNSITIVMDNDAVAVNEAVEEIYCDGVRPTTCDEIQCPSPAASPSQVFLNVVDDSEDDDDDFDPIACFLRPKQPLAKSPAPSLHSAISDHGYESIIGSPTSTATEQFDVSFDDVGWQDSFNDLFPSLNSIGQ